MNPEVYDDSPLHSNEIRLVKVLPGEWTGPIHCELHRTSLSDTPKYYTLSYVWGSRRARREIFLNGRPFRVTVNLESALRHLRLRHKDGLVIWIDALSINQADLDERTRQVELMGQIYQSSKTVFIYLGDGVGDKRGNKGAPEVVHFHGDHRDMIHIDGHLDKAALREKFKPGLKKPAFTTREVFSFLRALGSDSHLDRLGYMFRFGSPEYMEAQMNLFEALRRLMNPPWTPWWKRIWTVQEITMPKDVLMVCGSVSAPWSMFAKAASNFAQHSSVCCARVAASFPRDLWMVLVDFSSQVRDIKDLRTAHARQEAWLGSETYGGVKLTDLTLLRLLQRFRNRQASDSRDKVYALLSLAKTNAGGPQIVPDYTLSDREVYTQATIGIIQESQSLAVLSTDIGRKFRQDLPSWVPDWSTPGAQSNDIRADAVRLYSIPGLKRASNVHPFLMLPDSVLQVSASSTGVVSHVEEVMWGDSADVSRNTIAKWWAALENAGSTGRTRFWELLCAEIFCEKAPSSSNVGVRRTTTKDEITFMSWAIESPRSPFNLYPHPDEADQEVWPSDTYYDRPGDAHLDKMSSAAARLWKSLLYLDIDTPSTGLLLDGLLGRGTADDEFFEANTSDSIRDRLAPFDGDRTVLFEKLAEHGFFLGDTMVANGRVQEDVPWVDVFWEMEHKLRTRFDGELVRKFPAVQKRAR